MAVQTDPARQIVLVVAEDLLHQLEELIVQDHIAEDLAEVVEVLVAVEDFTDNVSM